jgi:DNA-binding LytR/AlgR family response regulator
MINIALCDDELNITKELQDIIIQYQKERIEEIHCDIYHQGEELLLADKEYDIMFLDIFMNGINGIETAKKIRMKDKTVEIIYLTSYSGLTREALSVHAFQYLDKPINKTEIFNQLDELIERILHKKSIEETRHHILEFNVGRTKIRLPVNDIYYFERTERKIKLVTKKGDFIINETIASIENRVSNYDFVMSHQSFILNINNIKDYVKGEIVMINDHCLPLAQKRASDFKRIMRQFLQNKLKEE